MLIFHTAMVMLSTPSEEAIWGTSIAYDWFGSDAFLLVSFLQAIDAESLFRKT